MFEIYYWKGKPIKDLKKFCKQHKTKMVKYKKEWEEISLFGGKPIKMIECGEMPKIFWDNLRWTERSIYTLVDKQ
jgi:hypothetical protein